MFITNLSLHSFSHNISREYCGGWIFIRTELSYTIPTRRINTGSVFWCLGAFPHSRLLLARLQWRLHDDGKRIWVFRCRARRIGKSSHLLFDHSACIILNIPTTFIRSPNHPQHRNYNIFVIRSILRCYVRAAAHSGWSSTPAVNTDGSPQPYGGTNPRMKRGLTPKSLHVVTQRPAISGYINGFFFYKECALLFSVSSCSEYNVLRASTSSTKKKADWKSLTTDLSLYLMLTPSPKNRQKKS